MLASCSYCGRIHDKKYICPQKAQRLKERQAYRSEKNKKIYDFHRSQKWKNKSLNILLLSDMYKKPIWGRKEI